MRFRNAPEGFRERLTEVLHKSDYSLIEIERLTGISHSSLSYYMSGKMIPGIWTLSALCKLLNVSADYLLFGERG